MSVNITLPGQLTKGDASPWQVVSEIWTEDCFRDKGGFCT